MWLATHDSTFKDFWSLVKYEPASSLSSLSLGSTYLGSSPLLLRVANVDDCLNPKLKLITFPKQIIRRYDRMT